MSINTDHGSEPNPETVDVLVVGSGIAGCAAALGAARDGANVLVTTKAKRPEGSSTWWAQGGIAVTRNDPKQFKTDIIDASAGTADPDAVETLVENADDAVRDVLIEKLTVEFDGNGDEFQYGQEAAHDEPRILHVDASTGKHIHVPFLNFLDGYEQVEIRDDTAALELITNEGRINGAVIESDGDVNPVYAGATILATGGIGDLYSQTTNPDNSTGDGIAMAALAGANTDDMEFVQFHPTVYASEDNPFLVSEAVRGEGALLRNASDERFMPEYHVDAELAPRDVVARAVQAERDDTGDVTLDVSPLNFAGEFPDLAAKCEERDIDWTSGIPVEPAEHFLCGGISVDEWGQTSLDRLYAVGECARTGVHGANRLASTSLLEGLVWGLRAGEHATGFDPEIVDAPELLTRDPELPDNFAREKFVRLNRVMDEYVGLSRNASDLKRANAVLSRLKGEVDAYVRTRTSRSLYELRAGCVTALLIARAGAENPDSVGCHFLEPAATEETGDTHSSVDDTPQPESHANH